MKTIWKLRTGPEAVEWKVLCFLNREEMIFECEKLSVLYPLRVSIGVVDDELRYLPFLLLFFPEPNRHRHSRGG